jgi:hypothetical protein
MHNKFSRKKYEAVLNESANEGKVFWNSEKGKRLIEKRKLNPCPLVPALSEFIKTLKDFENKTGQSLPAYFKGIRNEQEKECEKLLNSMDAYAQKAGLIKPMDKDELTGFYLWYAAKYDLENQLPDRAIYKEFHNYMVNKIDVVEIVKDEEITKGKLPVLKSIFDIFNTQTPKTTMDFFYNENAESAEQLNKNVKRLVAKCKGAFLNINVDFANRLIKELISERDLMIRDLESDYIKGSNIKWYNGEVIKEIERYWSFIQTKFNEIFSPYPYQSELKDLNFKAIFKLWYDEFLENNEEFIQNGNSSIKEISIKESGINTLIENLKPKFSNDDQPLFEQLIKGEKIEGKIQFRGKVIEFSRCFSPMLKDGTITSPKTEVINWIVKYFYWTEKNKPKDFNANTLLKHFDKQVEGLKKPEPSPKTNRFYKEI